MAVGLTQSFHASFSRGTFSAFGGEAQGTTDHQAWTWRCAGRSHTCPQDPSSGLEPRVWG